MNEINRPCHKIPVIPTRSEIKSKYISSVFLVAVGSLLIWNAYIFCGFSLVLLSCWGYWHSWKAVQYRFEMKASKLDETWLEPDEFYYE